MNSWNINLCDLYLKELPDFIKDLDVSCFYISNNRLTSLEGCPQIVGRHFDCSQNKLTSLKGCPKKIGGYFDCTNNLLESLDGCPTEVTGSFFCFSNTVKFSRDYINSICKVYGHIYC